VGIIDPEGILNGSKKIDLKIIAIEPATIKVLNNSPKLLFTLFL
jgi:hypothetical protein